DLIEACAMKLANAWGASMRICRASPIVSIADNYDRLRYPPEAVARDARYTRDGCDVAVLRTQTSAMLPPLLSELSGTTGDILLVAPGLVYRRDCIDRLHTGEPHQLDLWRIRRRHPLAPNDLTTMVAIVVEALLPNRPWRVTATEHPYTIDGLQIDV